MRVLHLFPRFRPNFAGDGLYFEKLWPHLAAAVAKTYAGLYRSVLTTG